MGTGGLFQGRRGQKVWGRDLIPAGPTGAREGLAGPQAVGTLPRAGGRCGMEREDRGGDMKGTGGSVLSHWTFSEG